MTSYKVLGARDRGTGPSLNDELERSLEKFSASLVCWRRTGMVIRADLSTWAKRCLTK